MHEQKVSGAATVTTTYYYSPSYSHLHRYTMMASANYSTLAGLLIYTLVCCCRADEGSPSLQGDYVMKISSYPDSQPSRADIMAELQKIGQSVDKLTGQEGEKTDKAIADCSEADESGVYTVESYGSPLKVFCQVDRDGKWTVIQRREDGTVNFYRNWDSYRLGFGDVSGEFWLGNENIHLLTAGGLTELRVDLEDWEDNTHTVLYKVFNVGDAETKYTMTVSGFEGETPPGDSFSAQNGQKFTTFDQDNDVYKTNCAAKCFGAWWYTKCHSSNLNGIYNSTSYGTGVNWYSFKGYYSALKKTAMMIRKP